MDYIFIYRFLKYFRLRCEFRDFTNILLLVKNKMLHRIIWIIIHNQIKVPVTFIQKYSKDKPNILLYINEGRTVKYISTKEDCFDDGFFE